MTESFGQLLPSEEPDARFHGVAFGIVTNNKDADGLGRVRVKLPWMADDAESNWARVATPMGGPQRGCYFLPEVGDEVLVAFEHGNPEVPYVLGGLWNGKDKPPASNADGKNDLRLIKSRSGHVIRLNDKQGEEQIEIVDKSTKNRILIDAAKNQITISADADIVIQSKTGKLTLNGNEIQIAAKSKLAIEAGSTAAVSAKAVLELKGQIVKLN